MTRGFRLGGEIELVALRRAIDGRIKAETVDTEPHLNAATDRTLLPTQIRAPAGAGEPPLPAAPSETRTSARHDAWKARQVPVPERDVLAAILALLRRHPQVAWATRMNVGMAEHVNPDGSTRRVRFAFAGCPDIVGMLKGGRSLLIEVKSDSGRLTEDQQAFLDMARKRGAAAFVARSVDDVLAELYRWRGEA